MTDDAPATTSDLLRQAAVLVEGAAEVALLHADPDAAKRRRTLAARIVDEADYAELYEAGAPIVRRRTDAPASAALGWYLTNDPAVRAQRAAMGLSVPEPEVAA